ncbi:MULTISPECIES: hypothetical protein [Elizabethkingia]|uniref:DUF2513 domain-containing protein n=2 Tax=Elizabethkingia TaxID=308865 RepID=A0A1T3MAT8_9FLAO|nr:MULTISPECIES: hypothetical protein [Elizabethkingia]MCT4182403.1 hypothetical protein [Elizabethkingia anophelis]MCT4272003.1 hypothetical protein [Elizabethkingia anophelis]MCT4289571.1 hypothetical protein [Elizabethkingia anophelis]MDE5439372.1 hypothetical protein [Elizabethkingia meningoseptica]MDE5516534.1 hypothetical protein [Elizabethkingia meningoseptica]
MINIDFLDRALNYLSDCNSYFESKDDIEEFTEQENEVLPKAYDHLVKDGYAYSRKKTSKSGFETETFYISFEGLLALETAPKLYKRKPYKWRKVKNDLNTIWSIVKICAVLINAIVILVFTYLTYMNKA